MRVVGSRRWTTARPWRRRTVSAGGNGDTASGRLDRPSMRRLWRDGALGQCMAACERRPSTQPEEDSARGKAQFIELCSGTGRLAKAAQDVGFKVMVVDFRNKHVEEVPTLHLDLTEPAGQGHVRRVLQEAGSRCHLHIGLPCGTFLRAREIPLAPALVRKG